MKRIDNIKTVYRVTKLNAKSLYYVTRLLPSIKTVLQVQKDVKRLDSAIKTLDSISHDFIAPSTEDLKEDLKELKAYLNGFKRLLNEELGALSLNLFSMTELKFINNLIDN